jgi:hypothetical protein
LQEETDKSKVKDEEVKMRTMRRTRGEEEIREI